MRLDRTYADYTNNLMLSLLNTLKKMMLKNMFKEGTGQNYMRGQSCTKTILYIFLTG